MQEMEVLIEKKMIDIKSEPVDMDVVIMEEHGKGVRRRSSSTSSQPTELEPSEEFPILYGLLTAPKSFKPRNSEELGLLPVVIPVPAGSPSDNNNMEDGVGENCRLLVTSRVQLVDCSSRRRRSRHNSNDSVEEADSQNLDYYSRDSSRSSSSNSSRSPQFVDSSSCQSGSDRGHDENNSPAFINYSGGHSGEEEDDSSFQHSVANSPGSSGSSSLGDDMIDDNIPTSTTSGFKRKASRLEHAIGNIVKRKGRVQKRSSNNGNCDNNTVPISMAPSSPTVSTTCVDPPPSESRGRSEILERILRSTTTTNTVNPEASHHHNHHHDRRSRSAQSPVRRNLNDNNNNEAGQEEPYAKLRDLLTMPEDQLVKRRRLEYGLSENKSNHHPQQRRQSPEPMNLNRRREFSPPRNNILASLLQKGRVPYEPSSYHHHQSGNGARHHHLPHHPPALVSINKLSDNSGSIHSSNVSGNDERPYKCSLCDLRFKKLPLLNRHVKTHSHIKRYVCRFCSHAFKRSDNLLAHMRTSCKGIKETEPKYSGSGTPRPVKSNRSLVGGQIIPQLLSSPPTGPLSPMVSRSQLEEALLNLRQEQIIHPRSEKCSSTPSPSLVSTTTGSPPPPSSSSAFRAAGTRRVPQPPPMDFQFRHSKLLEILSGSPVTANNGLHLENRRGQQVAVDDDEVEDMPLPLSLKIERRSSSPSTTPTSSSSPNQSQLVRSHNQRILYSMMQNRNELPPEEDGEDDEEFDDDEENDNMEPLNLGRPANPHPQPPTQQQQPVVQSARSRDHPEIVSILSRQPKNVMMGPDLRKLVGIDA